jgi:hypothetical protein
LILALQQDFWLDPDSQKKEKENADKKHSNSHN